MNDEKFSFFWTVTARPKVGPCYISEQFNNTSILLNVLAKWSFKRAVLKTFVR